MAKSNIYGGKEEREFYGRKLKVIREESNVTQKEMAEKLNCTPSVISKLEKGDVVDIERYAELYALCLKYLDFEEKPELNSNSKNYNKALAKKYKEELEQFFDNYINISTYAIPDTNAIENNPRIIEELLGGDKPKYHKVFVPDIVITELEYRKKYRTMLQEKEIAKAVNLISENPQIITIETDRRIFGNHDDRIIDVAKTIVKDYNCKIHIITNDKGFKAKQKINSDISVIRLSEFMQGRYSVQNMMGLYQIDRATSNYEKQKGVNMRAYLPNGKTLITSTLANKKLSDEEAIAKIKWLCENGADINQRESSGNFFPPLTIAIQQKRKKLFDFILQECGADPNAGSRNPFSLKMVRQQNEGSMPLMVAARSGLVSYVETLCAHKDIILNQQDSNGFTALIKVAFRLKELQDEYGRVKGYMKYKQCCEILIDHGIDYRIIDVDGHSAGYYFDYITKYIQKKSENRD